MKESNIEFSRIDLQTIKVVLCAFLLTASLSSIYYSFFSLEGRLHALDVIPPFILVWTVSFYVLKRFNEKSVYASTIIASVVGLTLGIILWTIPHFYQPDSQSLSQYPEPAVYNWWNHTLFVSVLLSLLLVTLIAPITSIFLSQKKEMVSVALKSLAVHVIAILSLLISSIVWILLLHPMF